MKRIKVFVKITNLEFEPNDKVIIALTSAINNATPKCCYIITPSKAFKISTLMLFIGTNDDGLTVALQNTDGKGWAPIDTSHAKYPDQYVAFSITLLKATAESTSKESLLTFTMKRKIETTDGPLITKIGDMQFKISLHNTVLQLKGEMEPSV